MVEILDALSPLNGVSEVYFQKPTQIGATELAINLICYHAHYWPCGMMLVMNDEQTVKKTSKQKLGPTIKESPVLQELISDRQGKQSMNNLYDKEFPGGFLQMGWASSGAHLRSTSCPVVILDELSKWPRDASGEGDPVDLIRRRIQNFRNSKLFAMSSPLLHGSCHIDRLRRHHSATDERCEVPCPECGHYQELKHANLVYDRTQNSDGKWTVHGAVYRCEHCACAIEEKHKHRMLANYRWVARNKDADGSIRSFWVNGLYVPRGWLSWKSIGQMFFDAQGSHAKMKVFTNTVLAETFRDQDAFSLVPEDIPGVGEDYDCSTDPLPANGYILTMGVDVQDDRLEGEVVLWGEGDECWGIEYFVADGDPSDLESEHSPWNQVRERLERRWIHPVIGPQRIVRTLVDSGGHFTAEVYSFTRPLLARQVYSSRGASTPGKPPIHRSNVSGLVMIGTEGLKDRVVARLKQTEPGPGFWHFPAKYPPNYFEQITAEQRVSSFSAGRPVTKWKLKPGRRRNEAFDIRVLNCAALEMLGEIDWKSVKNQKKVSDAHQDAEAPAAPRQKRKGFVNSWRHGL